MKKQANEKGKLWLKKETPLGVSFLFNNYEV
jgi:hypothetical protein